MSNPALVEDMIRNWKLYINIVLVIPKFKISIHLLNWENYKNNFVVCLLIVWSGCCKIP